MPSSKRCAPLVVARPVPADGGGRKARGRGDARPRRGPRPATLSRRPPAGSSTSLRPLAVQDFWPGFTTRQDAAPRAPWRHRPASPPCIASSAPRNDLITTSPPRTSSHTASRVSEASQAGSILPRSVCGPRRSCAPAVHHSGPSVGADGSRRDPVSLAWSMAQALPCSRALEVSKRIFEDSAICSAVEKQPRLHSPERANLLNGAVWGRLCKVARSTHPRGDTHMIRSCGVHVASRFAPLVSFGVTLLCVPLGAAGGAPVTRRSPLCFSTRTIAMTGRRSKAVPGTANSTVRRSRRGVRNAIGKHHGHSRHHDFDLSPFAAFLTRGVALYRSGAGWVAVRPG